MSKKTKTEMLVVKIENDYLYQQIEGIRQQTRDLILEARRNYTDAINEENLVKATANLLVVENLRTLEYSLEEILFKEK